MPPAEAVRGETTEATATTVAAADTTTPLSSDTTMVITEQCQELAEAIGDNPADEGGDFGQVADQLEEAAAIAPAEVADDLDVLAQTYRDAADRLEAAGIDMENPETFAGEEALAEMEEVLGAVELTRVSGSHRGPPRLLHRGVASERIWSCLPVGGASVRADARLVCRLPSSVSSRERQRTAPPPYPPRRR